MADIFEKLKKIENTDLSWFDSLNDKEKTEMCSIVMMRWLYGSNDPQQIIKLNKTNRLLWKIPPSNKHIAFSLLAASITKKGQRYKWFKMPKRNMNPEVASISKFYSCSTFEAEQLLSYLPTSGIEEIIEGMGEN